MVSTDVLALEDLRVCGGEQARISILGTTLCLCMLSYHCRYQFALSGYQVPASLVATVDRVISFTI